MSKKINTSDMDTSDTLGGALCPCGCGYYINGERVSIDPVRVDNWDDIIYVSCKTPTSGTIVLQEVSE